MLRPWILTSYLINSLVLSCVFTFFYQLEEGWSRELMKILLKWNFIWVASREIVKTKIEFDMNVGRHECVPSAKMSARI